MRDLREIWDVLIQWQKRVESRRALSEMEPRQLRDIGLTRAQAAAEAAKPFWVK